MVHSHGKPCHFVEHYDLVQVVPRGGALAGVD